MKAKETRERIAAAALRLLEKGGAPAVSMRQVASAVALSPMAIYHHFANREALLQLITDREFAKMADSMQTRPTRGTTESRLLAIMDDYVDYALTRPNVFDHVFSQPRVGARRFPADFRGRRSPTLNRVADLVDEAMRAGELRRDDVWEVAFQLWASVHGYLALHRAGRIAGGRRQFRSLYRRSLGRLLLGLRA